MQRLRLLRPGVPVRRPRPARAAGTGPRGSRGRAGLEVHALLRPHPRGDHARLRPGLPTESIQYGPLDELRERAAGRLDKVVADGFAGAQLYGDDPGDGVGGFGAFFLLLDEPETYGLPPAPRDSTRDLGAMWRSAAAAGAALLAGLGVAFLAGRDGVGT